MFNVQTLIVNITGGLGTTAAGSGNDFGRPVIAYIGGVDSEGGFHIGVDVDGDNVVVDVVNVVVVVVVDDVVVFVLVVVCCCHCI